MCLLADLVSHELLLRGLPHILVMWPLHRAAHHLTGNFFQSEQVRDLERVKPGVLFKFNLSSDIPWHILIRMKLLGPVHTQKEETAQM